MTAIVASSEIEDRKTQARILGYWLIAGTDDDRLHAIARLIPSTPHTRAALHSAHPGTNSIEASCPYMGSDVMHFAVMSAVDAALDLARTIQ